MPSRETLITFREGLKVIQTVDDYVTLKDTIIRMMAFTPPADAHFARDAIARTMRKKQATELQQYQGHPQQVSNLDQKYRDLYVVLKSAKIAPEPPKPVPQKVQPAPKPPKKESNKKQMVKASAFSGLNGPLMVVNWLKSKKKTLLLGTALASSVGGLFWMYKFLTKDETKKENPEEKESGFDKTIKSIQRYRAFTQASKDPDFMGDYEALVMGKQTVEPRKVKKKPEMDKSTEWDQEERALMRNMDSAFHVIGTKPKVKVDLPQLPEPRGIDPNAIIKLTRSNKDESPSVEKPKPKRKRKRKPKPAPVVETPIISAGPSLPKPRRKKKAPVNKEVTTKKPMKPSKPAKAKTRTKAKDSQPGRLIPIVKRTKRVKKVRA